MEDTRNTKWKIKEIPKGKYKKYYMKNTGITK